MKIKSLMLIAICFILVLAVSVHASEAVEAESMLTDILLNTNRDKIQEYLNRKPFDESMDAVDLEKPILLIYNELYPAYADDRSFEENVDYLFENGNTYLLLFEEEPVFIGCNETNVRVREIADVFGTVPSFVYDIANGAACQTFLGEEVTIRDVYCFNSLTQHRGVVLVYETDGGRFVRYYEHEYASYVEFSWDDYEAYAIAYFAYISSYEYNYDENGYALGGGISFLEFTENPEKYVPDPNINKQPLDGLAPHIIAGVALLLCTTWAVIILLHRRKKYQHCEE